jgi:hypothetical protein
MTGDPEYPIMLRIESPPTAPKCSDAMRGGDSLKWMSDENIRRYRAMATECLAFAERVTNDLDKQAWLRLASDWNALAEGALRRRPDGESLSSISFSGTGPLHRRP